MVDSGCYTIDSEINDINALISASNGERFYCTATDIHSDAKRMYNTIFQTVPLQNATYNILSYGGITPKGEMI